MTLISLSTADLLIAASLVILVALLSWRLHLGSEKQLLIAAARSAIQLMLLGFVLKLLFESNSLPFIMLLMVFMLSVAGYEVMARQRWRFTGAWGYGIGAVSMFISSFSIMLLTLLVIIQPDPWYQPQYAIPLLGMLLGNTMTGVAVGLDNLTRNAWEHRHQIETRLILGQHWNEAIADIRKEALRSGLIPIINSMAAAGVVSLPGMMTGQILAGSPPYEAAKYQLLIMYLITAGTGFGSLAAVWLGSRHLFDERHRLRLERLTKK